MTWTYAYYYALALVTSPAVLGGVLVGFGLGWLASWIVQRGGGRPS